MKQYLDLLRHIKDTGVRKSDRTRIGTKSVFGYQMRIDLSKGFPLLTTKKMFTRGIIRELLWFLKGDTNIKYLVDNGVHIWDEWPFQAYLEANNLDSKYKIYSEEWKKAKSDFIEKIKSDSNFARKWGDLGPVYGKQWTKWGAQDGSFINQIAQVQDMIRKTPDSRRIVVSAWNVADIQRLVGSKTAAPPLCHTLFQFYVSQGALSCQLYQRSADAFLGVPFNIASYSLLTMMIAQTTNLKAGDFVHTFGDLHIYSNHSEQVDIQLSRSPRPLPKMIINPEKKDIFDFDFEDFKLVEYDPYPAVSAQIAV